MTDLFQSEIKDIKNYRETFGYKSDDDVTNVLDGRRYDLKEW